MDQKPLGLVPPKEQNHPSLKTEKKNEGLQLNIKCCEKCDQTAKRKQKTLQTTIKDKDADPSGIKKRLQTNPGYHTLEHIED